MESNHATMNKVVPLTARKLTAVTADELRNKSRGEFVYASLRDAIWEGRFAPNERIPEEERPTIDRFFPQVRLSIVSTGVLWDRRDNPLTPTRGTQSDDVCGP